MEGCPWTLDWNISATLATNWFVTLYKLLALGILIFFFFPDQGLNPGHQQ